MVDGKCWVATDTGPLGTVVAISSIESQAGREGLPSGKFLNAVLLKHSAPGKFKSAALQQLVYESHGIFRRAQLQQKQAGLEIGDILSLSLEYRSVIRSALLSVDESDEDTCSLLSSWELIWSLMETVFFKPSSSSIVVDLIAWARICLVKTDYIDEISSCLLPSKIRRLDKEIFWKQVIKDDALKKLSEIIDQFDVSAFCDMDSEGDLSRLRQNLRGLVESGLFEKGSEAFKIAMLLMGHLPTFKAISSFSSHWFEILPLYAFLYRPNAQLEELPGLAKECAGLLSSKEEIEIDTIVGAVCSLDALLAVQQIARFNQDWWLAAHLSDLLRKVNSDLMNAYGIDARQHLLMEYGTQLFEEPGMWSIGFDYLLECGAEGEERLALLISNFQVDNEAVALKLISRCSVEGYGDLVGDIERSLSLRFLLTGQWSTALIWGMRTEDSKLLETISNRILAQCSSEDIAKMSILEGLNEIILVSPSLVFLHKYYHYKKLFVSGQKKAAALCLVSDELCLTFH
ncbi:unnamed protein product [Enterobius vermicularis]|uniref:Nuclear pore complex protein Nup85 n=1 Tax=Enterobius vermicularis TaxID=51028 RepID=A0A0N4UWN1_ENTVE|nr:unnamed protein product [Enterobius vermicularis]